MPRLMNQSASLVAKTTSEFGYSAARPDDLKNTIFTLADIEIDLSPSVEDFLPDLSKMLDMSIETLNLSANVENILARIGTFDENLTEVNGFTPLSEVKPGSHVLAIRGWGTALYDAVGAGVEILGSYGKALDDKDYAVNAVLIIVTDGKDTASKKFTAKGIATAIRKVKAAEHLEGLKVILIGVGDAKDVEAYLTEFQTEATIDQFEWAGKATPEVLARIAGFISASVSSASDVLKKGNGGVSQDLSLF